MSLGPLKRREVGKDEGYLGIQTDRTWQLDMELKRMGQEQVLVSGLSLPNLTC